MKAKSIVVVDDDPAILEALDSMLKLYGYKVATIPEDGVLLQKTVDRTNPNVIILDVMLSGRDGRDVCKKLKKNAKTAKIPVIMISAHPDVRESTYQAGAEAFLPKPFDINELLEAVEKFTSH